MTSTNPLPIVGKNAADPLMARANTEAMMTSRTASNAVFSARERLLLSRTMIRVAQKTIIPRNEICRNVSSFGSTPKPSNPSNCCKIVFIARDCIARNTRCTLRVQDAEKQSDRRLKSVPKTVIPRQQPAALESRRLPLIRRPLSRRHPLEISPDRPRR
jgi:hypothetical protein